MKKLFSRGNFLRKSFSKKIRSIFKVATMKIKVATRPVDVLDQLEGSLVRAQTHLLELFSVHWNLAKSTSKKTCWQRHTLI